MAKKKSSDPNNSPDFTAALPADTPDVTGEPVDAEWEENAAAEPEPQETSREYLRRNFTPEERLTLGDKLSQAYQELTRVNEDLASCKADFKSRITALEGEVANYSRMLQAGYEMANIECPVTRDYDNKMIIITHPDTGEVVRKRPMTYDEQQRSLLPPAGPDSPAEVGEHLGVKPPEPGAEAAAAPQN